MNIYTKMEMKAKEKLENESSKSSVSLPSPPNYSPPTVNPFEEDVLLSVKMEAPDQWTVDGEDEDEVQIHKKEAICKVCINVLPEEKVVIMRKCRCEFTLIHEECATQWSKNTENRNCDVCKQKIQIVDVHLSRMFECLCVGDFDDMRGPDGEEIVLHSVKPDQWTTDASVIAVFPDIGGPGGEEDKFLIVKVKTPQRNADGEQDEKIHKMEAVCKFCYDTFQEDNVLKTKCRCRFTLIHKECAKKLTDQKGDNKCDVCKQDVQNIQVILSTADLSSSTPNGFQGCCFIQ